MGVGGLSFDDFSLLTPFEFQAVLEAYSKEEERRSRDMWECMRVLAAIDVSPYSKRSVLPKKLLRLPWDDEHKPQTPPVSLAEDKARLAEMMKKLKMQ